MTICDLPLNTLCLSGLNVRRTERAADIESLAEDIAANGLKQNLVVVPAHYSTGEATEGWEDKWEVIAGGRRYQAMMLLVADGRWPADQDVACLLDDRDQASATSLSENLHKVAMNPADEFAAYHTIVHARETRHGDTREAAIAACAKRFGKTVAHITGRLRLAALCPEVLDALRADRITLDAAKAYATTADHDLQRKVFGEREKDKFSGHHPNVIRNAIRGITLPLDAPLVTFVGLVEYQARGGRIESEMFMGSEGQQRVVDVSLLESMAPEIAEPMIAAQAKADGYKSGMLTKDFGNYPNWPKEPAGYVRANYWENEPSKAKLKKSIAVYGINDDGIGLKRLGRFKPADEVKAATPKVPQRDWKAERRAHEINDIAARLATLALIEPIHTPELDERLIWPDLDDGWVSPVTHNSDDETTILVAVQIRINKADIKPHLSGAAVEWERANAAEKVDAADAETAEA